MSDVRTDPLTAEEIATYHEQGYLFPIRVLDDAQVEELREALDDHLEGRRESQTYELTDPIVDSSQGDGDRRLGHRRAGDDRGREEAALGPVPVQPLGARRALLEGRLESRDRRHGAPAPRLEGGRADGGRRGDQEAGRRRQALLAPGLRLLAARLARRRHVLDRARRRRRGERRDAGGEGLAQAGREAAGRVRRRHLVHAGGAARDRGAADARGGRARGGRLRARRPASAASTTRCSGMPRGRTRPRTRAAASSRATSRAGRGGSGRSGSPTTTRTRSSS